MVTAEPGLTAKPLGKMPGGVRPPDHKRESLVEPIATPPLPRELRVPLAQYGGALARPVVDAGTQVRKGQLIATGENPFGSAVHAPTSGTVQATAPGSPFITLVADGCEQWIERIPCHDYRQHSPAALRGLIADAGIVGLGGGGFPTATKLDGTERIETLIINAAECEPYITADAALLRERADEVLIGVDILAFVLGEPARVVVGVEDNNPGGHAALIAAVGECAVAVVEIPARYPSGGERQLIQILTGLEVPSGALPAAVGVLCVNVATAYAIYRAVCLGEPLIARIVTVTGGACAQPRNYEALIGTPIEHLLNHSGYQPAQCAQLTLGGPMQGVAIVDTGLSIAKTTNCILAPTVAERPQAPPAQACIRCGFCADVCPAGLLPQQLYWYARTRDQDRLAAHNLFDCIECGACSYVCPSAIPLVPAYRAAKAMVIAERERQIAANRARLRFQRRAERLAALAAVRATRRTARQGPLETARARVLSPSATPTADSGNTVVTPAPIVAAAIAQAAADKPDPARQRGRLQRALVAAEDSLRRAEDELGVAAGGTPSPAQRAQRQAKVVAARWRRDAARRRLDDLDTEPGQAD